MNNVTPEKKEGVIKSLAVFGLLTVIILIAWLAVQIVKVFPSAISSLASLADTVYNYNPNEDNASALVIETSSTEVTSGEGVVISWNQLETGTYTFSYECADGVSIDLKTNASEFAGADCGQTYDLGNVAALSLVVNSEKQLNTNLHYTVSYFKTNDVNPSVVVKETLNVQNPNLAVAEPEEEVEVPAETATSTPTTPTTPRPTTPTYTYNYSLPVSNPNGYTDLTVTYLGVGQTNSQGFFRNIGFLERGESGAIQFAVKNIGTKTSGDWTLKTELPGGIDYESGRQLALKPNERAIITVSFSGVTDRGTETFSVAVLTNNDNNRNNNQFDWSATVK